MFLNFKEILNRDFLCELKCTYLCLQVKNGRWNALYVYGVLQQSKYVHISKNLGAITFVVSTIPENMLL